MGSVEFKNKLPLRDKPYGTDRRRDLAKEILNNGTPLPDPVNYKDIDREFKSWVENELKLAYEGKDLPTVSLFSNQRFGEYMQSWQNLDDKKNFLMNFKVITRENNPKAGKNQGNWRNIPGDVTFLMKRVPAVDDNGREYFIDYRMKQPFCIDLVYKVSVVTNKYELLNEMNELVNEKFKAINAYIRPKGHFMSMELKDISDESQYNIDNRQYYSQSFNIVVLAYIISEDSFEVVEHEKLKVSFMGDDAKQKSYAEVEEGEVCEVPENNYYYKPVQLTAHINRCDDSFRFIMDEDFTIESFETENIRSFQLVINGKETELGEGLVLNIGDEVKFRKIYRYKLLFDGIIRLIGISKSSVYDSSADEVEFEENREQFMEEIELKEIEVEN